MKSRNDKIDGLLEKLGCSNVRHGTNSTWLLTRSDTFLAESCKRGETLNLERLAAEFCERRYPGSRVSKDKVRETFWPDMAPGEDERLTWSKDKERIVGLLAQLFEQKIEMKIQNSGVPSKPPPPKPDYRQWQLEVLPRGLEQASIEECKTYLRPRSFILDSFIFPKLDLEWIENGEWSRSAISKLEDLMHHLDLYMTQTPVDQAMQYDFELLVKELISGTQLQPLLQHHKLYKKFAERCLGQLTKLTRSLMTSGYLCETKDAPIRKSSNFDQAWQESLRQRSTPMGAIQQRSFSSVSVGSQALEKSATLREDDLKISNNLGSKRNLTEKSSFENSYNTSSPRAIKRQNTGGSIPEFMSLDRQWEPLPFRNSRISSAPLSPYVAPFGTGKFPGNATSSSVKTSTESPLRRFLSSLPNEQPRSRSIGSTGADEEGDMTRALYCLSGASQSVVPLSASDATFIPYTETATTSGRSETESSGNHSSPVQSQPLIKLENFEDPHLLPSLDQRGSWKPSTTPTRQSSTLTKPTLFFTIQKLDGLDVKRSEPYEGELLLEKTLEEFFDFFHIKSGIIATSLQFAFPFFRKPRIMTLGRPGEDICFRRFKLDIEELLEQTLCMDRYELEVTDPGLEYTSRGKGKE